MQDTTLPSVVALSPAVQAFVSASESLLSPALRPSELTPEECQVIAQYVMDLSNVKTPWSGHLLSRYT
jgi:hypothetical protein